MPASSRYTAHLKREARQLCFQRSRLHWSALCATGQEHCCTGRLLQSRFKRRPQRLQVSDAKLLPVKGCSIVQAWPSQHAA